MIVRVYKPPSRKGSEFKDEDLVGERTGIKRIEVNGKINLIPYNPLRKVVSISLMEGRYFVSKTNKTAFGRTLMKIQLINKGADNVRRS